ncbi:hypothetical protein BMF81_01270 [Nodularia spumigena UHCC 0039]|uniref:Uncharacterized protein n=2 Tax=Nodularia spumigena TaxID=70799 RepID=A0A2S0Q6R9_NODSP|nr:hypothetical protein BMF81_01270 [Nodularia spumigena UHCC 0039]
MNRRESLETQKKDLEEKIDGITTEMGLLDPALMAYNNLKKKMNYIFLILKKLKVNLVNFGNHH